MHRRSWEATCIYPFSLMDWIFEEAYKVVQQLLDGTLTTKELIPLLTIIILFGALLARKQIAAFIQDTIERVKEFRELEQQKEKLKVKQKEVEGLIEQIETELLNIESYKAQFESELKQTLIKIDGLPSSLPVNDQQKTDLKGKIGAMEGFYRSSLNNFEIIQNLLKDIAEVHRAPVVIRSSDQMAEDALAEAQAEIALRDAERSSQ
jgi:hypothetical protein